MVGGTEEEGLVLISVDEGLTFARLGAPLPRKMRAIAVWGEELLLAGDGTKAYCYRV